MYFATHLCYLVLVPRREFLSKTFVTSSAAAVVAVPPAPALSDTSADVWHETPQEGTALSLRTAAVAAQSNTLGQMAVYPDPILRHVASPVTDFGPSVDKVANLHIDGMKTNSTTALQYGIDARIMVLKGPASTLADGAPLILINPNVLARSGEDKMVPWAEHCGNFVPTDGVNALEVDLLRDEVVEVAAQDVRGIPVRKSLRGEAARAFQHELDHLDGLLIVDHADLDELPKDIAELERPYHRVRQRRAFERRTYQGNEPLYR